MKSMYIDLKMGSLVKDFMGVVSGLEGSFELIADRTVLDAKSILGIYSLDLSKPLLLKIEQDTPENIEMLSDFMAK